jgi:hypothetical protein
MIKAELKKYFWDVDFKNLDINKRKIYVLRRLLEYGNPDAIRWIWKNFTKKDWSDALKGREISLSTKNFWRTLIRLKTK